MSRGQGQGQGQGQGVRGKESALVQIDQVYLRGTFVLALCFITSFVLSSSVSVNSDAASSGWKLIGTSHGVKSYTKPMPGSKLHGFRGESVVDEHISVLLGTLNDVPNSKKWIKYLTHMESVQVDRNKDIIYQLFDMPWPLTNREFLMQRTFTFDPKSKTVVAFYVSTTDPRYPEKSARIRSYTPHTAWKFTALSDGRTYVEVESFVDPHGSVPPELVNFMQRSWPHDTLLALVSHLNRTAPDTRVHNW